MTGACRWVALLMLAGCAGGKVADLPPLAVGTTTDPMASADDGEATSDTSTGPIAADDGESTAASDSTSPVDDTTGGPVAIPSWLVTLADGPGATRLLRIDPTSGSALEVCTLPGDRGYDSLVFARSGELYAHSRSLAMIHHIDPCSCTTSDIMQTNGALQLTVDDADGLLALDTSTGQVARLDLVLGTLTPVAMMNGDFTEAAIAWSDAIDAAYVVNAVTDELYFVDQSGIVALVVGLLADFQIVGLDVHPANGLIYACSQLDVLSTIDSTDGTVAAIGPIGSMAACDDLAAPWGPIDCIE